MAFGSSASTQQSISLRLKPMRCCTCTRGSVRTSGASSQSEEENVFPSIYKSILPETMLGLRELRCFLTSKVEKEMETHSSILAWKTPWREEPGGLQSMGSQRVRHDWATEHSNLWREWQRIRWLDGIIDSTYMSLSKLWELVKPDVLLSMGSQRVRLNSVIEQQKLLDNLPVARLPPIQSGLNNHNCLPMLDCFLMQTDSR